MRFDHYKPADERDDVRDGYNGDEPDYDGPGYRCTTCDGDGWELVSTGDLFAPNVYRQCPECNPGAEALATPLDTSLPVPVHESEAWHL